MSKQVETHVYQPDSSLRKDWNGSYPCATCGLPRRNQHHEVKPTDEDVKALEARKIGDG